MKKTDRGFTLIELLVVISIIATLATIGAVSFSSLREKARDSVRKNDLKQLALALEVYRQANGKYPCTDDLTFPNGTNYSNTAGTWITGTLDCGDESIVPKYVKELPRDPLNTGNNLYHYWSGDATSLGCSGNPGQYFILFTRLENRNDIERHEVKLYQACNDIPIISPTTSQNKNLYFVTPAYTR